MPNPPEAPNGLRQWGQGLWDKVVDETTFDPAGYYILAEACRTADVIERLSGALRSNNTQWISLSEDVVQAMHQAGLDGMVAEVHLVVNPILSEIRQQRLAMRQLLAQLKLGKVDSDTADDDPIARMMAEFLPE